MVLLFIIDKLQLILIQIKVFTNTFKEIEFKLNIKLNIYIFSGYFVSFCIFIFKFSINILYKNLYYNYRNLLKFIIFYIFHYLYYSYI